MIRLGDYLNVKNIIRNTNISEEQIELFKQLDNSVYLFEGTKANYYTMFLQSRLAIIEAINAKKKKGKDAITKELKQLAEKFNSLLEKYGAFKEFKNDLSIKIDSENTDLSKENAKINKNIQSFLGELEQALKHNNFLQNDINVFNDEVSKFFTKKTDAKEQREAQKTQDVLKKFADNNKKFKELYSEFEKQCTAWKAKIDEFKKNSNIDEKLVLAVMNIYSDFVANIYNSKELQEIQKKLKEDEKIDAQLLKEFEKTINSLKDQFEISKASMEEQIKICDEAKNIQNDDKNTNRQKIQFKGIVNRTITNENLQNCVIDLGKLKTEYENKSSDFENNECYKNHKKDIDKYFTELDKFVKKQTELIKKADFALEFLEKEIQKIKDENKVKEIKSNFSNIKNAIDRLNTIINKYTSIKKMLEEILTALQDKKVKSDFKIEFLYGLLYYICNGKIDKDQKGIKLTNLPEKPESIIKIDSEHNSGSFDVLNTIIKLCENLLPKNFDLDKESLQKLSERQKTLEKKQKELEKLEKETKINFDDVVGDEENNDDNDENDLNTEEGNEAADKEEEAVKNPLIKEICETIGYKEDDLLTFVIKILEKIEPEGDNNTKVTGAALNALAKTKSENYLGVNLMVLGILATNEIKDREKIVKTFGANVFKAVQQGVLKSALATDK